MSEATAAAESAATSRRWNGFVCPGCRLVFRIPSDHDGRGVVCPSCRRLLRLPQAGDEIPRLVTVGKRAQEPAKSPDDEPPRHRRRRRKSRQEKLGWESLRRRVRSDESIEGQFPWLWASGAVLLAFAALLGVIRLLGGRAPVSQDATLWFERPLPVAASGQQQAATPGSHEQGDSGEVDARTPDPMKLIAEAEPVARRLVAARSVEEMLPLVRCPAEDEPKMREWYARNGFKPAEIREFAVGSEVAFRGRLASVGVVMSDFSMRQMAVEETADGYRIDWQSWVGWSELPWSEIRDLRPVEPKVFRVIASNGDYFNFGFADDRAWRCYKLDAPDGEHLLYGYVERGSELDGKLTPVGGETARSLTLRLRYPKDAPAPDQVIIDSIVANGWVVGDSGSDQ